MSRRIVCFYEDASDAAVPVVLKCKDTLRQTIAEALSEFGLDDQPVTSYALCLNFQELTVRLSESEFHNLPTSGRPPQLRLISLQDLKALCASQRQHHTYFDDSRGPSASPDSSQTSAVHNHHQPNESSTAAVASSSTSSSQRTVPKKRGRPSRASIAAAAEEPQQPIYSGPVTTDTRKLWLAGGPGQGDDADTSQRYRKRRMVLGRPGASNANVDPDESDQHTQVSPEPANHENSTGITGGTGGKRRSSGRPRRSAADNASHAIAESAANGGEPVSQPAVASMPSAAHKILPKSKKSPRPSSSSSNSAAPSAAKKRKTDETDTSARVNLTEVFDDVQQMAQQNDTLPLATESSDLHAPLQIHEPLPDAYIAELQGRTEPNRSEYWIGFCFAEQPGDYILQRDIWVTYQRHTSQYGPGSPEGLSPSALIGLFSTVFPQGEAKIITSSTGEQLYVVVNVRAKRINTIYSPENEPNARAQADELKLSDLDNNNNYEAPQSQSNEAEGKEQSLLEQGPSDADEKGPKQSTPANTQDTIALAEPDAAAAQQDQQHDSFDAQHELDDSHDEQAHTDQHQQRQSQQEEADPAFQVDAQEDGEPNSAQVNAADVDQGMEPLENYEADPNERHEEEDVSMSQAQAPESEPQSQPELQPGPEAEAEAEREPAPEFREADRVEGTPELDDNAEPPQPQPTEPRTDVHTEEQHQPQKEEGHWPRVDFSQPPESPHVSSSKQDSPSPSSSEGDPLGQQDEDGDHSTEWYGRSPTLEHFAHHSGASGDGRQSEQLGQITAHDIEEIEDDEGVAAQLNDRITVVSEEPHQQQTPTSRGKSGFDAVEPSSPEQAPQPAPADPLKDVDTFFYT